ncbi:MAG TPA: glutamate--tRNA ligase family protein [Oligoflexia bacterium]|nr:glutamate--tRNA ligase family protein [Oligoflexia bacterium]HMP26805.1 glutamate--tRNA ligase family protein [Oligoflexia bacterium]
MDLNERAQLAEMLFPKERFSLFSLEELETRYPKRELPSGALVTRMAPSPTGFMHIGGIYTAIIDRKLASQSGGVFILRIEDTDVERTVPGAIETIIYYLNQYNLTPDEGPILIKQSDNKNCSKENIEQRGNYGSYIQTQRLPIYHSVIAQMIRDGTAYPCFCSQEELEQDRQNQRTQKIRTGYYGEWARWRNMGLKEISVELEKKSPFVIRLRSQGKYSERISWEDGVRRKLSLPANDIDHILLKSDLIPVYHFAVVVDDHFMRVTDIIRGEEWIASVPIHLELYSLLSWTPPKMSHISTIQKLDQETVIDPENGESVVKTVKRKLSKRKDPEANMNYFHEKGYPVDAVVEYLLNLVNSDFENWRKNNPYLPHSEFQVKTERLSPSGALADETKLLNISKDVIAKFSIDQTYALALDWCLTFDRELGDLLAKDPEYAKKALGIEKNDQKSAKRIACWQDLREQLWFFYDELFEKAPKEPFANKDLAKQVLESYLKICKKNYDKETWFAKCKEIAKTLNFATSAKEYKESPQNYVGQIGEFMMIVRIALCGSVRSPDLWEFQTIIGSQKTIQRIKLAIGSL